MTGLKVEKMKAYKITDKNGECNGHKYEVGKTYAYDGKIVICSKGFHASKNPMDAQQYRDIYDCRLFEVECTGEIQEQDDKLVCSKIKILRELTLKEWIELSWKITFDGCGDSSTQAASGDYSKQAASGYSSKQAASGDSSTQETKGQQCISAAVGKNSRVKVNHKTSWFVISDVDNNGNIIKVVAKKPGQKIDGVTVKTGHWYWFQDGVLHEEKCDD